MGDLSVSNCIWARIYLIYDGLGFEGANWCCLVQEDDDDNYESDDLDEGKLDAEGLRRLEEDQKALLKSEQECGGFHFIAECSTCPLLWHT